MLHCTWMFLHRYIRKHLCRVLSLYYALLCQVKCYRQLWYPWVSWQYIMYFSLMRWSILAEWHYLVFIRDFKLKYKRSCWRIFQKRCRVISLVKFRGVVIDIVDGNHHYGIGSFSVIIQLCCLAEHIQTPRKRGGSVIRYTIWVKIAHFKSYITSNKIKKWSMIIITQRNKMFSVF